MAKFNSLIYYLSFTIFALFSISCESLGLGGNQEDTISPFEIGDSLYFSLQDINPNSETYGDKIGPQSFNGKVVLLYFTTNETWDVCIDRFGQLYNIFEENIDESTAISNVMLIGIGKHNSIPIDEILANYKITPWIRPFPNIKRFSYFKIFTP